MDKKISKETLIMRAKHLDRYCELLIEQCDNWLDPPKYEETKWERKRIVYAGSKAADRSKK